MHMGVGQLQIKSKCKCSHDWAERKKERIVSVRSELWKGWNPVKEDRVLNWLVHPIKVLHQLIGTVRWRKRPLKSEPCCFKIHRSYSVSFKLSEIGWFSGADLGGGCRDAHPPPPPWDDLRFSNTTGILQKKKTMWFIGVEVEQETSAPPPKKNPGSAPDFSGVEF